jgi:hypothetical protein
MADITEEVTTVTIWVAIAAVIISVGITGAAVISDIAVFADITSAAADVTSAAATGVITAVGAIVTGGTIGTGADTAAGGTVVGGPMALAPAGAGRRITTASSGFATKTT